MSLELFCNTKRTETIKWQPCAARNSASSDQPQVSSVVVTCPSNVKFFTPVYRCDRWFVLAVDKSGKLALSIKPTVLAVNGTPAQYPHGGRPMTAPQQIDSTLGRDLTLKQLVSLSHTVKATPNLSPVQQTKILQNISKRIWQRSVCEYDGY